MACAILTSLKHLKSYNSEKAADLLKELCKLYFEHEDEKSRQEVGDLVVKEGGAELLVKMFTGFSAAGFFSSNLVWFPTYYALSAIWNLSDASFLFAKKLGKLGAVQYLLAVLDHRPYKEKLMEKNVQYLIKASLSILHNTAKVPKNRPLLRQDSGVQKIAYYTKVDNELLKMVSIMLLGYIINEDESELIMDESGAVETMLTLLQGALESKDGRCHGYTASEITEGLVLIANCEKNKKKIFESGVIPKCEVMMKTKDCRNRLFATKLVWQLVFSCTIRKKLEANSVLMELLNRLSKDTDKEVCKSAHGALWVIQKQAKEETKPRTEAVTVVEPSEHIMISYQWSSQKTMLKLNRALQDAGIKVWMDVEQMAGSTLQAMAEAVEKASVVLIGVSAKYKDSPNCRTEAEYSFELRKEIIPLMMEQNYKPDGWLGALLGTKLWIDFSGRCNFEESIKQLIRDIKGCDPMPREVAICNTEAELVTWTKADVSAWLKDNGLHFCLNSFAEYDGSLLYQLQQLRKEAPEFFYSSLRNDLALTSLNEILQLLRALDKIGGL